MKSTFFLATALLLGTLVPAQARIETLHRGSFTGTWCGYAARFDLQTQHGAKFDGRILINKTGQYDRLFVEQFRDDSIRIIRYLAGAQAGNVQTVDTFPPQVAQKDDLITARFAGKAGGGVGCEHVPVLFILTP